MAQALEQARTLIDDTVFDLRKYADKIDLIDKGGLTNNLRRSADENR